LPGISATDVSEAVARLDLDESAIEKGNLKKAFRKMASTVHPDYGGCALEILQFQKNSKIIERKFRDLGRST
jgi:DnaJ-class molecular chaperone